MRPVRQTLSAVGATNPITTDHYQGPFNIGLAVILSPGASLTYTVEHTFDDVHKPGFDSPTATWFPNASLSAKTTTSDGNYAFPVMAVRLNVTSHTSGSVELVLLQAGSPGR